MHLLMISIDGSIGKAGTSVQERIERYGSLVDGGIDIILLGTSSNASLALKHKVFVHPIISKLKICSVFKAIMHARRLVRDDTVITVQDPFELGIIGVVVSLLTSKPLNVQVHIDFFSPYFKKESIRQRIQSLLAPFVLRRATSVRVVSEKIATYISEHLAIAADKIIIAPVFVDGFKVKTIPVSVDLHTKYSQFDWVVLVASRFVSQKNIPLAIEAFDIFSKKHHNVGMVIIGSGKEESAIRTLVQEKRLDSVIRVDSSLTTQFISCMKTSDAFLLSSDYEGWGMTVIEAAAAGSPIIMTKVGCADEFITHGENGLIVPVRDRNAIVACLERYYTDRIYASRIAKKAETSALTYMTQEESDELQKTAWERATHTV